MPGFWGTEMPSPSVDERRHETKLVIEGRRLASVEAWLRLHPAGFRPTYPQRQVQNIYFDTLELANVEANLAGISERQKLRLRWYGQTDHILRGTWELKCKQAGVGWKVTQPAVQSMDLRGTTWGEVMPSLLATTSGIIGIQLRSAPWPALINHFERRYYESWDESVRATVDDCQTFYDQRFSSKPNLTRAIPFLDAVILEFKAAPASYDRLAEIVELMPMRITRNSKYVSGLRSSIM